MKPISPLSININDDDFLSWTGADTYTRARLFEFALEHANDPVIITTTQLDLPGPHIVYVNRAFTLQCGYSTEEAIGQTPRILQGPLTDRAEIVRMRSELLQGNPFVGETINYRKDGSPYFMEWSVNGLYDDKGVLHFYVAVQRDVSASKAYEQRIQEQARELAHVNQNLAIANQDLAESNQNLATANQELAKVNARLVELALTDSLTGLANHRAYQSRLKEELDRAKRYQTPLSLLSIDVDRFKSYNDVHGHPEGDVALQQIAELLKAHTRSSDCVARPGGEEFAVILPNTDHEGALCHAENLRAQVEAYNWPNRPLTISIGTSTTSPADNFTCPLIQLADEALYRSKSTGRNRVS
ncbi:diguanylate cyclase [bacterium]|nr:MAG: diguanylate cyclase [bacterium]